MGGEVLHL